MALFSSKCCNFASQSAGQEPTIFAGQLACLTEGLSVWSGHKNLDRFHLCPTTLQHDA